MRHVLSALGVLALGYGLALPAVAEPRPGDQVRSQMVSFSDLDLGSGPGAAVAVRRISAAARSVCDENSDSTRDLRARAESRRCRSLAIDTAVKRLDAPRVSATRFAEIPEPLVTVSAAASARTSK